MPWVLVSVKQHNVLSLEMNWKHAHGMVVGEGIGVQSVLKAFNVILMASV